MKKLEKDIMKILQENQKCTGSKIFKKYSEKNLEQLNSEKKYSYSSIYRYLQKMEEKEYIESKKEYLTDQGNQKIGLFKVYKRTKIAKELL